MEQGKFTKHIYFVAALLMLAVASLLPRSAFALDTVEVTIGSITNYTYASTVYPIEFKTSYDDYLYVKSNRMSSSGDTYYYNVMLVPKCNSHCTNTTVFAYDPTLEKNDGAFMVRSEAPKETIATCVDAPFAVDVTGYSDWYTDDPVSSVDLSFSEGGISYDLNSYVQTNSETSDYDGSGYFKFVHEANISLHTIGTYEVYICKYHDGNGPLNIVKTLEVTVSDHSFDDGVVAKEATCTQEGQLVKTCSVCGMQQTEPISVIPHEWSTVFTIDQEPTCAMEGKKSLHCVICDGINANSMVSIAKLEHSWSNDYEVDETPTCIDEGSESIHCEACGAVKEGSTRTIAALGHSFTSYAADGNATCESDGTKTAHCDRNCGVTDTVADVGSAIGHAWGTPTYEWAADNATVVAKRSCENNPLHTEVETANASHVTQPPTCDEAGEAVYTAVFKNSAFEGQSKTVTINALGHEWGAWETVKQPTCTEKGKYRRVCFNDPSHVDTRETAALGHDYQSKVVSPTCTKTGYTMWTCSRCGNSYIDSEVPTTSHEWNAGEVTQAATYDTSGVLKLTCIQCGKTRFEEIPALGRTSLADATISGLSAVTYTSKMIEPNLTISLNGQTLKAGADYTVSYKDNINAGTAKVTVAGKGAYAGSKSATFKISKAANPITAKAAKKSVSLTKVTKKAQTVKPITVKGYRGTVSYKIISGKAKAKKVLKVNAKNGKVTVKKGTGKGTYVIKVKASAKGNANYKAGSKTVTVKVVVK